MAWRGNFSCPERWDCAWQCSTLGRCSRAQEGKGNASMLSSRSGSGRLALFTVTPRALIFQKGVPFHFFGPVRAIFLCDEAYAQMHMRLVTCACLSHVLFCLPPCFSSPFFFPPRALCLPKGGKLPPLVETRNNRKGRGRRECQTRRNRGDRTALEPARKPLWAPFGCLCQWNRKSGRQLPLH